MKYNYVEAVYWEIVRLMRYLENMEKLDPDDLFYLSKMEKACQDFINKHGKGGKK